MYKCLLELLEYDKNRSIYLLSESYKKEKCSKIDCTINDKIYSSREGDRLCKCRYKFSESVKYKPELADIILHIVCLGESRIEHGYLMFLSREDTDNLQIRKSVYNSIKKTIPVLIGCTLILVGSIPESMNSPYRKREQYHRDEGHPHIYHESRYQEDDCYQELWNNM